MTDTTVFFAHANGFPARTYSKMLERLAESVSVRSIDRLGHDPAFPVTDNWPHLKDELRHSIERQCKSPVVGVGHSLGGVLHLMVACERPDLYERLILLDAPVISRLSSHGLRILKFTNLIDRMSPSRMTRFRRRSWESRDEALRHFSSKPKFSAFDPDVLRDYVTHAVVPGSLGYELFFSPKIEAKIYRTIPDHLPKLKGFLRVPATYIGGFDSIEGRLARTSFMKKHFGIEVLTVPGSHLFPFERPLQTADLICRILSI